MATSPHIFRLLDSLLGPHSGLNADWCCRCWLVKRLSKQEAIWLFDEEDSHGIFALIRRKENADEYVDTELVMGTLREIRDWMAQQKWCHPNSNP